MSDAYIESEATLTCGAKIHVRQQNFGEVVQVVVTPQEGTTIYDSMQIDGNQVKLFILPEVILGINSFSGYLLGVPRTQAIKRLTAFIWGLLAGTFATISSAAITYYILHWMHKI